nr:GNAT family N-acetyltransferase [uncultured Butyrivibrio sp.]
MTEKELWAEFCSKKNIDINTPYEVWGFGGIEDGDTDKLAELVLQGKKFGTASSYDEYVMEDALDELPKPGDYSVILNSEDEAVCVIRDYDVYVRAFGDVPPFHAYAEGEGDRTLMYWRDVHMEFFKDCLDETEMPFNQESRVVCEKFSVEYIPGKENPDEELLFVEPTMIFAKEIAAYRQEMLDAESSFDGCFSMKRMPDIQEYVDYCIGWANPRREADEHGAWGNVLLVIRKSDMKMVGCMQVHNVLTERMEKCTGHVGYSVRPSERRKGYAKKMLAKALDFLSSFGFEEVYVSCLPENEASKKTIWANGGELVETVYLKEDGVNLEKYRIRI